MKAIDVSSLPKHAFGSREPLFYGVMCLIAIEGTFFALAGFTYLYVRGNVLTWPPPSSEIQKAILPAATGFVLLLASIVPIRMVMKRARAEDRIGAWNWLAVATVLGLGALGARVAEFAALPFEWDSHSYGSIVWVSLGLHTAHILTGTGENLLFLWILAKGPLERKHFTDLDLNAMYWLFVVLSWVPFFAILQFDPGKGG